VRPLSGRTWELDLYIGLCGLTPFALLGLEWWALAGYP
jgi:hypothetical protein